MAFANKLGNLVKRAVTSNLPIYQSIRCMSSSKVFVGGLSYGTDDQSLGEAFANYGEVTEARVIMDRETGRSRGFGFVSFTSGEEASAAISALDGKDLHGRIVKVNYATERTGGFRGDGGYGGGGYGGGGGGYGGGGYGGGAGGYGGGGGGYADGSVGSGGAGYGGGASGGYGGGADAGNFSAAGATPDDGYGGTSNAGSGGLGSGQVDDGYANRQ